MKNKIFLLLFIGIFLISLTSAETQTLGTFKQNLPVNLIQTCDNCTYVNLTSVTYPNSSFALQGQFSMTKNGNVFNYSFPNTSALGDYSYSSCGDLNGILTCGNVNFIITSTGKSITTGNSIIIFLSVFLFFILGGAMLFGYFKNEMGISVKWTLFLGAFIFFLTGLNLISAIIPDALINENIVSFFDSFTAISFLLFWFAFGLIAIVWGLTFFQTVLFRHKKMKETKYGIY